MEKVRENCLRWFRHLMRREEMDVERTLKVKEEDKPKERWMDTIENDKGVAVVCVRDV